MMDLYTTAPFTMHSTRRCVDNIHAYYKMLAKDIYQPTKRPTLKPPPSLEFAQLIAHRRACRVAENRQMEQNNNHFWNMKNSIELENAFQEKQRMESRLRIGNVPAHISHRVAAGMMRVDTARDAAMDVDEEAELIENGLVKEMARGVSKTTQSTTREAAKARGEPHMERFTDNERKVAKPGAAGAADRLLYPEAIISRNIKVRARNIETQKAHAHTDNKRVAGEIVEQLRRR